jgi:cobalt-zinc-cadmium efflux system outer membrane protein
MAGRRPEKRLLAAAAAACLSWLLGGVRGEAPQPLPVPAREAPEIPVLTVDAAVRWALANNPELAAGRQQHGIAAARVVIARTYPFNPVLENRVQDASGPASATITNDVPVEHILLWEVELRGQRAFRRQGALAGLSRTDWDIARQEQLLAARVLRAFYGSVYQEEKVQLAEAIVRFNEQLVSEVRQLLNLGQVRGADLILAETEVTTSRTQVSAARIAATTARYELRRALGAVGETFVVRGGLDVALPTLDLMAVTQAALECRGDLHARQAALAEARANLRLTVANRYGNPTIGTAFIYDPTRISEIGGQLNFPIPVLNTHRGEILERRADESRAAAEMRETEVTVRQDVQAALARLELAGARVDVFRNQTFPQLRQALDSIDQLFRSGERGVDLLKVVDVRRKLLQARDLYLDALFEVTQARADLVAAVGDPGLGLDCGPAPAEAATLPEPNIQGKP